jgi:thiol-disulfide isomerase/thioredoxin
MRNQFRFISVKGILSALGIQAVPSRVEATEVSKDRISARESSIQFLKQREAMGAVRCPSFPANADWINSRPLSLGRELKGKIVLLDFFTYCCINCQHVLPKLAALEKKYGQDGSGGFVVVGVHSAKFSAERETANIAAALERYGVLHPVVNDERMEMWNTIGVSSWPTFVLVGPSGTLLALWSGEQQESDVDELVGAALEFYNDDIDRRPLPQAPTRSSFLRNPTDSPFRYPGKLVVAKDGKSLFISDTGNNRIVRVDVSSGACLSVFGDGRPGLVDANDSAKSCFRAPQGLDLYDGRLYVADTENHAVRMIELKSGAVTTVGGNGQQGYDYMGNKRGSDQLLSSPWDIEISVDGIMYVAMAGTHQIWSLDVKRGDGGLGSNWQVFSGSGRELEKNSSTGRTASWAQPSHMSIGERGSGKSRVMFVADSESSTVRYIQLDPALGSHPTGTLAGGDGLLAENLFAFGDRDGVGARAKLQHPLAVIDGKLGDRVFVADSYNHRIKTIDSMGRVVSFVGNGKPGFVDGKSENAQFWEPSGLAVSGDSRSLYVSDTNNCAIRIVDIATRVVSTLNVALVPRVLAEDIQTRLVANRRRAVYIPVAIFGTEKEMSFRILLPAKCHFTEGITSRWQANEILNDGKIKVISKGMIALDGGVGKFSLPLRIPSGNGGLEVESVVYFCSEDDDVCRTEADVFQCRRDNATELSGAIEHKIWSKRSTSASQPRQLLSE